MKTGKFAYSEKNGTLESASEHLFGLARKLKNFVSSSETQFLAIGAWLRDFHGRAAKVSGLAVEAADTMLGRKAGGVIRKFELLLQEIEGFLGEIDLETGRNRSGLEKVQHLIGRLQFPLEDFHRVVKTLQILRLSAKVENSAFGREDMNVLAEGMDNLSLMIADKTAHASMEIGFLDRELAHVQRRLADHRSRQRGQVLEKLKHARRHLSELLERRRRIASEADELGNRSADISRQIGNVVTSMQFHDITRQQVEHVCHTLERLGEDIDHGPVFHSGQDAEFEKEAIGEVCELQAAQLEHAQKELAGAVQKIIKSLEELAGNITATARGTLAIAGAANRGKRSFFSGMEPAIGSIASVLAEMVDQDRESSKVISSTVSRVAEMTGLVAEFGLVGSEMKVVAANAGIRAAHAGDGGLALGVIAKAIQQLAGELLVWTGTLAADFTAISSAARSLNNEEDGAQVNKSLKAQEIMNQGTELLKILEEINDECIALLEEMEKGSLKLAEDIAIALSSIAVHHECQEMISSVCDGLQGWFAGDRSISGERITSKDSVFAREIISRYSMQSERRVHERKTALIIGERSGVGDFDSDLPWGPGENDQSELGANVELF